MIIARGEQDIVYDRFGAARLRILTDNRIVSWQGTHLGFLYNTLVYNYRGEHVGWYRRGIMRDLYGSAVGFGLSPTDKPRPYLPYKQFLPHRGNIGHPPQLPYPHTPHFKPPKLYSWSDIDLIDLFGNQQ